MAENVIDIDIHFAAKITKQAGLITIPAHLRKTLRLEPGDSVVVRIEKIIKLQRNDNE